MYATNSYVSKSVYNLEDLSVALCDCTDSALIFRHGSLLCLNEALPRGQIYDLKSLLSVDIVIQIEG